MKTDMMAAAGVWIEFVDQRGHTVAQHVVDEWHGRPVPNRGDHVDFADIVGVRMHRGIVIARHFDVQHSLEGLRQVWVRLVVRVNSTDAPLPHLGTRLHAEFSRN
jgi:hypothetical protein